ncbi:phosphopantetheine binding protein [Haloactinospora alba]|uniref:Phosphopantetheine binding protein n=1 Tax=Haloactinospora alba TaxID=405555 RepID=A0A543N961_9ACTN|nr:phosphopantetheine-binding protein [Haloactinospora alba]TQN28375.1 phosphopantetheine binding protein [Haloactinospora alba]
MTGPPWADAERDSRATAAWIAGLYAHILEVGDVSADSDFFVLGGTSLLAMRLLDTIAETTGTRIPVRAFYHATRVSELAREVDARLPDATRGA